MAGGLGSSGQEEDLLVHCTDSHCFTHPALQKIPWVTLLAHQVWLWIKALLLGALWLEANKFLGNRGENSSCRNVCWPTSGWIMSNNLLTHELLIYKNLKNIWKPPPQNFVSYSSQMSHAMLDIFHAVSTKISLNNCFGRCGLAGARYAKTWIGGTKLFSLHSKCLERSHDAPLVVTD